MRRLAVERVGRLGPLCRTGTLLGHERVAVGEARASRACLATWGLRRWRDELGSPQRADRHWTGATGTGSMPPVPDRCQRTGRRLPQNDATDTGLELLPTRGRGAGAGPELPPPRSYRRRA